MTNEIKCNKIFVNYLNDSIEELFKGISVAPALMGKPTYNASIGISQEFQLPFTFLSDASLSYNVNEIYNSRKDMITFSGSMVSRLIDMYGFEGSWCLPRHAALIHTEFIEDIMPEKNRIRIYGISRPKLSNWLSSKWSLDVATLPDSLNKGPFDKYDNYLPVMTGDEKSIDVLFKHVSVFTGKIHRRPDEYRQKGPMEFKLYFIVNRNDYMQDIDISSGLIRSDDVKEYNMRLNDLSINTLMHLLGAHNHYELIGKKINVHASYIDNLKKLIICGISSKDG